MSFAVSFADHDLEWAGTDLGTVFGQRRNLLRPAFHRMLADLLRFNRAATRAAATPVEHASITLGEFLERGGYGHGFREWYLLPMAAAIWSCPKSTMLGYPFATFARFCHNHALLQVTNRPRWMTVGGGGREYVKQLAARIADVRTGMPVRAIDGVAGAFALKTDAGTERFDQVVLACHSDQALALLAHPTPIERDVLGRLRYQPNRAVLHTDARLLPRRAGLWSAWNYIAAAGEDGARPVGVSYLINKLQPLPFRTPVVVTLNPPIEPRAESVIAEFDYAHPVFDRGAVDAQAALAGIQGQRGLWFCGAWAGYGFHEDGLKAGLAVANALGEYAPWQDRATSLAPAPASAPGRRVATAAEESA
jgi:predicted NAD/FAD-binding protein